jgi:hypothetical protein
VRGWPELQGFLEVVNATASPIESVGCEKVFSPVEASDGPTVSLGSYIDVIFTDRPSNDRPENILLLASQLIPAVEGCEKWWGSVSLVLQCCKFIGGTQVPWGMMFQIQNAGRTEEEARRFWGESLRRLGVAVATLRLNSDDDY